MAAILDLRSLARKRVSLPRMAASDASTAAKHALRVALVACVLAACASPPAPGPSLRVSATAVRDLRGFCPMPLRSEVDDPPRIARFAAIIEEELRKRGFEVVRASDTTAVIDRLTREEGGFYDSDTGERQPDRYRAVSQRVRERLGQELACQALLSPRIIYVTAFWLAEHGMFSNGTASWDGARVDLGTGRNAHGSIGALSLQVRITDLSDRELFFGTGGIRTTSEVKEDFLRMDFVPVEPARLLADEPLNRAAVQRALEGLPGLGR
jgi:hypothetical protein